MDVMTVANQVVGWLNQLPEHEKQKELVQMQKTNPQLYSLVLQLLQQTRGANRNSAAAPLPEQRPPMRGPEAAMV
jgi:cell division inhibitor SulA